MNCWKTINVNQDLGKQRIVILSILIGTLSFITMYVPFSIMMQHVTIKEPRFSTVIVGFLIILLAHKLVHILPILFTNKELVVKTIILNKILPVVKINLNSSLSKRTCLLVMVAPTVFITFPLIMSAVIFSMYYPIIILWTAFHIGLSLRDWITFVQLIKAPKRCVVEKMNSNYDILINSQ
ncbi:DUF3267 domain-containing protein [Bacillaceae bacterium W0354]